MSLLDIFRRVGGAAGRVSPLLSLVPGGAAIGMGLGIAGRLARGRGGGTGGAGAEEADMRNRFIAALGGYGPQSEDYESQFLEQMSSFDPSAGFAEQTEAELNAQDEDFARRYGDAMGTMVGAGRLPTKSGYGLQDTQDLVQQGQRERAAIRARNAGAATQARMQHLATMGNYASGMRNRFLDAISGRLNTLEGQRLTDQASRRGMVGSIAGGVLGSIPDFLRVLRRRPEVAGG